MHDQKHTLLGHDEVPLSLHRKPTFNSDPAIMWHLYKLIHMPSIIQCFKIKSGKTEHSFVLNWNGAQGRNSGGFVFHILQKDLSVPLTERSVCSRRSGCEISTGFMRSWQFLGYKSTEKSLLEPPWVPPIAPGVPTTKAQNPTYFQLCSEAFLSTPQ